jgi:hypothetical protein
MCLPPIPGRSRAPSAGAPGSRSTIAAGVFKSGATASADGVSTAAQNAPGAAALPIEREAIEDPVTVFQHPDVRFAAPEQQRIDRDCKQLTLVTRWADSPRESLAENISYGYYMASSIENTAADLSNGKIGNTLQLWERARDARIESFLMQKRAEGPADLRDPRDIEFIRHAGIERVEATLLTWMHGRYDYIASRIHDQAKTIVTEGKQVRKLSDQVEGEKPYANWVHGDMHLVYVPQENAVTEEEMQFGSYALKIAAPMDHGSENQKQDPRMLALWSFEVKGARGESNDFKNPFVKDLRLHNMIGEARTERFVETEAYAQTNAAFTNALKATERSEILDHAFEGYWHLVVAAPDHRGSAAKSHYALQSILLAKGINLPPAREGLAPDLEAMSSTRGAWLLRAREVFGIG